MLPAAHRLIDAASFREATRQGRRAAGRRLVAHLASSGRPTADPHPTRVGFVVSKAVGNAVVRNRVQRRLRHLVRRHLANVPPGSVLVVRALPTAADASSVELDDDLVRCLRRLEAAVVA